MNIYIHVQSVVESIVLGKLVYTLCIDFSVLSNQDAFRFEQVNLLFNLGSSSSSSKASQRQVTLNDSVAWDSGGIRIPFESLSNRLAALAMNGIRQVLVRRYFSLGHLTES